ncbi:hypothetical protein TURU_147121 [Turdus rufiventris]|nr:hypothetical protein TURU_147121 [Turdus rufiventris]
MELDSEYFVIGDTAHTRLEIEVAPMTIKGSITCLILLASCPQPPFYLVEGQILAQAIPIPMEVTVDGKSSEVYWAELRKHFLPLNPMMNPIQAVCLLILNNLAAAWIIPQPRQNVWVTLAQTRQQENKCLSTAAAENPMSTYLVGVPLKAGEYSASFEIQMPNELPESHTIQSYKPHRQQVVMSKNSIEELLPGLSKAVEEPQELELLGSYPAQYCIHFVIFPNPSDTKEFHNIWQYRQGKSCVIF